MRYVSGLDRETLVSAKTVFHSRIKAGGEFAYAVQTAVSLDRAEKSEILGRGESLATFTQPQSPIMGDSTTAPNMNGRHKEPK